LLFHFGSYGLFGLPCSAFTRFCPGKGYFRIIIVSSHFQVYFDGGRNTATGSGKFGNGLVHGCTYGTGRDVHVQQIIQAAINTIAACYHGFEIANVHIKRIDKHAAIFNLKLYLGIFHCQLIGIAQFGNGSNACNEF